MNYSKREMKRSTSFDKRYKIDFRTYILCFSLFFVTLTACNETFEPLHENEEYYFSMYGYLDANADTQWVRVSVPRESVNELPDPTGVTVTLEQVQSGETITMNDSLFTSRGVLNYWTTFDIKNEQTYRIKAEREDGKSSHVTVTIPTDFPMPIVVRDNAGFNIYVSDSVEHIADIQSKWYVLLNPETEKLKATYTFQHKKRIKHTTAFGGTYFVLANYGYELGSVRERSGNAERDVLHQQFFVAAAGPEWDESISDLNDLEYFLDGAASNVENGLGYVVGITSKWVPYKTCLTPDGSNYAPCPEEEPFW